MDQYLEIAIMDLYKQETVRAAQEAFMDVLELAAISAEGAESAAEAFRAEAEKTVLMMIAAIMLADGSYDPEEQQFIRLLVDLSDKPGGEASYLNDYAVRWTQAALEVPRFFQAAVLLDARSGSDVARTILRRIQVIGNFSSICDGKFSASEQDMVKRYVVFLEDFIEASRAIGLGQMRELEPESSGVQPERPDAGADGISPAMPEPDATKGEGEGPRGWKGID